METSNQQSLWSNKPNPRLTDLGMTQLDKNLTQSLSFPENDKKLLVTYHWSVLGISENISE